MGLQWGIQNLHGELVTWATSFKCREDAIVAAVNGLLPAHVYDNLKTNDRRWKSLYRKGYRLVRVKLVKAL